jgi:hypothetical protein
VAGVLGVVSLTCIAFWSLFLVYGLFTTARGQGDLTWWIWPPLLFAYFPLLLRKILEEATVDIIIVSLNALVLILALGFFLWERLKSQEA